MLKTALVNHMNGRFVPFIHTHIRLTIPMKCSKQSLLEEILHSLQRLELSQKKFQISAGTKWNVPSRSALNNFFPLGKSF